MIAPPALTWNEAMAYTGMTTGTLRRVLQSICAEPVEPYYRGGHVQPHWKYSIADLDRAKARYAEEQKQREAGTK